MLSAYKNSYLQLVCAMHPRVINNAVESAMGAGLMRQTEFPTKQGLHSMQPSLYAPHVDVTQARLGYGHGGLRLLVRQMHSPDHLEMLQAMHTLVDQLQISENAMFLIKNHVVFRLVDLMLHKDPVVKEKVILALTTLTTYRQGRLAIMDRPAIIENLMWLAMRDRKELRYAAANALNELSNHRCSIEGMLKCPDIVRNLLKMVKYEHTLIVTVHLQTLEKLIEWDQVCPLKKNAFQVMLSLMKTNDSRVVSGALNCLAQLCKHEVGRKLADNNDLTKVLEDYLEPHNKEVMISAVGLMQYTTLTVRSKWRAKEFCVSLTKRLMDLCLTSCPLLQLRAMQVLINLCDIPDIRSHMEGLYLEKVEDIKFKNADNWDGTIDLDLLGVNIGHYYRAAFVDGVATLRNDVGDNPNSFSVHNYVRHLLDVKNKLLFAINYKSYRH